MTLRASQPHDLDIINDWRTQRGMHPSETIPATGVVVEHNGIPVAAGFIRMVEGNWGMLDSYITDPEAEPRCRHEALDNLTLQLLALAEKAAISHLISFSVDARTVERAQKHGFMLYPSQVLFRSI